MKVTKKIILSFVILLLLIFLYDIVLHEMLWFLFSNIDFNADIPYLAYLRVLGFRLNTLVAIIFAVLTLRLFINRQMRFYIWTIFAYIAIDMMWLLIMSRNFITPGVTVFTLLSYTVEFIFAIIFVAAIKTVRTHHEASRLAE